MGGFFLCIFFFFLETSFGLEGGKKMGGKKCHLIVKCFRPAEPKPSTFSVVDVSTMCFVVVLLLFAFFVLFFLRVLLFFILCLFFLFCLVFTTAAAAEEAGAESPGQKTRCFFFSFFFPSF